MKDMMPTEISEEWAQWFPCWEVKDLHSLIKESRRKRKEIQQLLTEREQREREEQRQWEEGLRTDPDATRIAAFYAGFAKGCSILCGYGLVKMLADIPQTTGALRFNVDKLLRIQRLAEHELHRRGDGE